MNFKQVQILSRSYCVHFITKCSKKLKKVNKQQSPKFVFVFNLFARAFDGSGSVYKGLKVVPSANFVQQILL